jgi:hypothetical protein
VRVSGSEVADDLLVSHALDQPQMMLEKGGGQERCLVREQGEGFKGAGLLHFAVLGDHPEMIKLLWPYMKKCVKGEPCGGRGVLGSQC